MRDRSASLFLKAAYSPLFWVCCGRSRLLLDIRTVPNWLFSFIYSTMIASLHIQLHPSDDFFRIYFKKWNYWAKDVNYFMSSDGILLNGPAASGSLYSHWRQIHVPVCLCSYQYFLNFLSKNGAIFIAVYIYLISDEVRHLNAKFF